MRATFPLTLRTTLFFLACFLLPTVTIAEEALLKDGKKIYIFESSNLPERFQDVDCFRLGFKDKELTPLDNGRYTFAEGNSAMVEDTCLFPFMGESTLIDNRPVYFFTNEPFGDGNLVYVYEKNRYHRIENGEYNLKNGQRFFIINGIIENFGFFDGQNIQFEDRD